MMNKFLDFKKFREDLTKALEEVGKKYNVTLTAGSITYGENDFFVKIEGERADIDVSKVNFEANLWSFSKLKAEDYLKQIEIDGNSYAITGLKPGCKYSVIVKRADGRVFVYTYSAVLKALGRD